MRAFNATTLKAKSGRAKGCGGGLVLASSGQRLSGSASPGGGFGLTKANLLSVREDETSAQDDLCVPLSVRRSKRFHLPSGRLSDQGRERTRSAPAENFGSDASAATIVELSFTRRGKP